MSLTQVLNSQSSNMSKPATPVVRSFHRRKIEVGRDNQIQQIGSSQPAQVSKKITAEFPLEEDIIIFSLMSKLLLPKNRIEKINLLFQKFLLRKLSFITVSKNISEILVISPTLLNVWHNLTNRNTNLSHPIYLKIEEIVHWFKMNNIPDIVLFNFISAIANAKQHSVPYVFIFDNLVTKFDIIGNIKGGSKIMQFSLDLLKLLPKAQRPLSSTIKKMGEEVEFSKILIDEYKDKPFSIYPHYQDISTFTMRNGKPKEHSTHRHASARDTTFTPSHHLHQIPILDKQPAFFLNYYTKSLNSGHEGGSRGHDNRHTEIPLPPTRDIHDILEQAEIREHEMDSSLLFDEDTNFIGYIANLAGESTYEPSVWKKIQKMLSSREARAHVADTFRRRLEIMKDAHVEACHVCEIFLSTRPINPYTYTLRIPDEVDGISFPYYNSSMEVSAYSKSVFTLYTTNRYPFLAFFFRNFFPILSDDKQYMQLIGPKSTVMALYYYSKLCESIKPLLSKKSSEFETYQASYDIACEEIQNKYPDGESALPHRFLSKVLKSITKNGTILDDMSYEVYKHFGPKSIYVAQIAPILSHFNAACHCLSSDPRWNELKKMGNLFATAYDLATLESRYPIYSDRMRYPSSPQMYIIRSSPDENKIYVSLL